jgi:hypothetical protein
LDHQLGGDKRRFVAAPAPERQRTPTANITARTVGEGDVVEGVVRPTQSRLNRNATTKEFMMRKILMVVLAALITLPILAEQKKPTPMQTAKSQGEVKATPAPAGLPAKPPPPPPTTGPGANTSRSNSLREGEVKPTAGPALGNTITGCWVPDPGGKTAHWVNPCPGGLFGALRSAPTTPTPGPAALITKGLNLDDGHGCWVADKPGGNTAHWVKPCPR